MSTPPDAFNKMFNPATDPVTDMPVPFTELTDTEIELMPDHTLLVLLVMFARDTAKGMEEFYSKMRSNPIMRIFGG